MASRLRRVTSPGLPATPRLMLDQQRRHARVSLRHPTWKSVERAATLTELLILLAAALAAWRFWIDLPVAEPAPRFFAAAFCAFVVLAVVSYAFRASLTGFFARQVFATRTVFWFTPQAIAFRSKLYARPVVLWRRWKGGPVDVRFIVHDDNYAKELAWGSYDRKHKSTDHLKQARVLKVVLTTGEKPTELDCLYRSDGLRTIPITEIHADLATRCTMVYAAALAMTAVDNPRRRPPKAAGVDIESA